jgi:hypothetical protein
MIGRVALLAGLALALAPSPAHACSATRLVEGDTADERMAGRTDFRRVIGVYRIERIAPAETYATPGLVHGRLRTRRGRSFAVVQPIRGVWVECGIYTLPLADASGTFYLRQWARDGEYELLDWSGEHVPGNAIMDIANDAEGQP